MQKSFWWWQCSDRYIISLSPHLHTPFSSSLISHMVSVDVKHHIYLLTGIQDQNLTKHCDNGWTVCVEFWLPLEWMQNGSNVVRLGNFDCESCSCVLDSLRSIQKVLWYIREQALTAVQSGMYEDRNDCCCFLLTVQILRYWTDSLKFSMCCCASIVTCWCIDKLLFSLKTRSEKVNISVSYIYSLRCIQLTVEALMSHVL